MTTVPPPLLDVRELCLGVGDAGRLVVDRASFQVRAGEIVAVVPARALSWQQVTLPQGATAQASRLRAVLEGLLEEHLLDDPAQLHFALQPLRPSGKLQRQFPS